MPPNSPKPITSPIWDLKIGDDGHTSGNSYLTECHEFQADPCQVRTPSGDQITSISTLDCLPQATSSHLTLIEVTRTTFALALMCLQDFKGSVRLDKSGFDKELRSSAANQLSIVPLTPVLRTDMAMLSHTQEAPAASIKMPLLALPVGDAMLTAVDTDTLVLLCYQEGTGCSLWKLRLTLASASATPVLKTNASVLLSD